MYKTPILKGKALPFTRRNLYNRDKGICQLCKKHVTKAFFNSMHVVPMSEGGKTEWSNMIIAHIECNLEERKTKKFQRTHEAKLLKFNETDRLLKRNW